MGHGQWRVLIGLVVGAKGAGRETRAPHAQALLRHKSCYVKCRNLMGFLVAFKAAGDPAHGVGSFYHRPAERRTPYH
ncbi:hypothetical protein BJA5080_05255 [Bradyrhizobium diazoefficiens SEMIA 5080]|uniref:Uncharacterized protein n=1 Tax=Bradyrhizobium diazoefficiens SEMIA 5080 TaxID=754504 RepID=A0A837C342_9BRAD|nr:hypothetical protein BJA5080_05255 [Bradyrhizobium diazoefficiens SEMIA 5080]